MLEFVRMEYSWGYDGRSSTYLPILKKLQREKALDVEFEYEGDSLNFSIGGSGEALEVALGEFFLRSGTYPVEISVDKHSYICDFLSSVSPFFKSSTKKGHDLALELLIKRGAELKKGFYNGCMSASVFKF
jgi:hypothetical protein